jgi:hypothetical protein
MLHAAHDDAPRDANYRGFSEFRLFARDSYGTFQQIYDLATGNPYNTTPPPSDCIVEFSSPCHLSLWANLTPTTAQQFRAEFVQYGPSMGPRVLELDGYSYATVPEPSTLAMFLGLGGMGMIGAWRRRKRTA